MWFLVCFLFTLAALIAARAHAKGTGSPGRVASTMSLLDTDGGYCHELNAKKRTFFAHCFSEEGRLHRNGMDPATGKRRALDDNPYLLQLPDGHIASSGDLGYTYGTASRTTEGGKTQALNYLRVEDRPKRAMEPCAGCDWRLKRKKKGR